MLKKKLHSTDLSVSCLGLGTVKFGRNEQVKYPTKFVLPSDDKIEQLLELARDLGINMLDTAPAYGSSETRLGPVLKGQRDDWVIVSKAGEEFIDGKSVFDFSKSGVIESVERSLRRLQTDRIDAVLLHSNGEDLQILDESGAVEALMELKQAGKILSAGISTKTVEGGVRAVELGLDCVMVTYNPWHREEETVLDEAEGRCSVFIKKAFGSGWFGDGELSEKFDSPVHEAFDFIFRHPAATAVISGTINPAHLKKNADTICRVLN